MFWQKPSDEIEDPLNRTVKQLPFGWLRRILQRALSRCMPAGWPLDVEQENPSPGVKSYCWIPLESSTALSLGKRRRDLLLAALFLLLTFLGSSVGSAPLALLQSVIRTPVCGRTYSRPAALPLLTQEISGQLLSLHLSFPLEACIPNLTNRQSGAPCGEKAGNSSHLLGASTLAMTGITWSTTGLGSRSSEKS